jgi:hypothetical protein
MQTTASPLNLLTENSTYKDFVKSKQYSNKQIEFLKYFCHLQPCSINDLLKLIAYDKPTLTAKEITNYNKVPSDLKKWGIIKIIESKRTGKKSEDILGLTGAIYPNKPKKEDKFVKETLKSSIESAMLAIEVYNKPLVTFKSESFIVLMCIAWTKALHAYLKKNKKSIYTTDHVLGKLPKTLSLRESINKIEILSQAVKNNLDFFIEIRDQIVHAHQDSSIIDAKIFGQCQALIFNFEHFIENNFSRDSGFPSGFNFALQLSKGFSEDQWNSIRKKLSREAGDVATFIDLYRDNLDGSIRQSQEFSFKAALIPIVSNSGKGSDFKILFNNSGVSQESLEKFIVLEKQKSIAVINPGKLLPGKALKKIKDKTGLGINQHHFTAIQFVLSIRETKHDKKDYLASKTNTKYCHYDEPVDKHLYTEDFVDHISNLLNTKKITLDEISKNFKDKKKISI